MQEAVNLVLDMAGAFIHKDNSGPRQFAAPRENIHCAV